MKYKEAVVPRLMVEKLTLFVFIALAFTVFTAAELQNAKIEPVHSLSQAKVGRDGAQMALIPAGEFWMGTEESALDTAVAELAQYDIGRKSQREWFEDEVPPHQVYLDAYYIDRYEVTNAQYKKFVQATGYREPSEWQDERFNRPDQPVVGVSWDDALAYCNWAGKTLPTEAQWEKAARGGLRKKRFPWGDTWPPQPNAGNFYDKYIEGYSDGYAYTAPVGSFTPNGYGLYDMAGNVLEWCFDAYQTDYYRQSPARNPFRNFDLNVRAFRVVRGGGWSNLGLTLRCAYRGREIPTNRYNLLGFRCAKWVQSPSQSQREETRNLSLLLVNSNPPGATVSIDGHSYGITEKKPLRVVFDTGERGEKIIEVILQLEGYAKKTTQITLQRQRMLRWNATLKPLSEPFQTPGLNQMPAKNTSDIDGAEIVLIPAGEFQMGNSQGFPKEKPVHTVYLDAYYIDTHEVTNAQYQKFMMATGHPAPAYWTQAPPGMQDFPVGKENSEHPVVGVAWDDAMAYAKWAGKTLPTEAQWEKAARGGLTHTKYPLGDTLKNDDANASGANGQDQWKYTAPVGKFYSNRFGLYDMAGNVWEWCLDAYAPDYYHHSPAQNPANLSFKKTNKRTIRGGSWRQNPFYLSNSYRDGANHNSPDIGFRCVEE